MKISWKFLMKKGKIENEKNISTMNSQRSDTDKNNLIEEGEKWI